MEKNMSKLKGLIVEKGTTQQYVAKQAGINRSTFYRKLQSGGGEFTANEIRIIGLILGLTGEEILTIFLS
ncbi:MAG: XRE family transcriptional regulator [Christensenellales bacterium]